MSVVTFSLKFPVLPFYMPIEDGSYFVVPSIGLSVNFVSAPHLLNPLKGYFETRVK